TALLIAGAGGSAICADLGSRKIRDEIDAMEVLGISPIQRLVVPRVLGCMLVSTALNGLVCGFGVAGGYFFGLIAGVVASYKGLNAGGGPKGVGDAVNQSVVITFLLLFVVNFVITAVYFQVVPPKGS